MINVHGQLGNICILSWKFILWKLIVAIYDKYSGCRIRLEILQQCQKNSPQNLYRIKWEYANSLYFERSFFLSFLFFLAISLNWRTDPSSLNEYVGLKKDEIEDNRHYKRDKTWFCHAARRWRQWQYSTIHINIYPREFYL